MKLYRNFNPSVSIILPTFNRSKLIDRAIKSILNQTFELWELIIVDDGSNDNTYELIDKHISANDNIRYMKHSNKKLPLTMNTGIMAACGEFITFIGSDDEYKPEHLSLRYEFMNNNPEFDLLHGGVEIVGDPYVVDKNDSSRKIHLSECIIGGTIFGKRKMFLELDGFRDIDYSEDSEFFGRAEKKFRVQKVDFPTYVYYRDTPDSICNTKL